RRNIRRVDSVTRDNCELGLLAVDEEHHVQEVGDQPPILIELRRIGIWDVPASGAPLDLNSQLFGIASYKEIVPLVSPAFSTHVLDGVSLLNEIVSCKRDRALLDLVTHDSHRVSQERWPEARDPRTASSPFPR